MATALELPASVRDRPCFQQYLGSLAVSPAYLQQVMHTISELGMPAVWQANEKLQPSMFSPSILSLALALRTAGLDVQFPDAHPAKAEAKDGDRDAYGAPPYAITGGTAIIPVNGPLSKQPSSLQGIFGGSSTVGMRKALSLALADPKVSRIMFHIDSPGGTVAGTGDLGDDIFVASSKKPIASFIEDMGTSAAYWLASQGSEVYASQYANVGSIGVIWTVYDTSEMAKKEGIKVHAIMSSPGKAFAVGGMPITDKQLAKMQAYVDDTYSMFLNVVARGRGASLQDVRRMSGDADIYSAPAALDAGLVDAISTFREALADFATNGKARPVDEAAVGLRRRKRKYQMPEGATASADGSAAATAPTEADEADSYSDAGFATSEVPLMDPPPNPNAKPAAAPVSLTAEEHQKLKADAAAGVEALNLVRSMQKQQEQAAAASLATERERVLADCPSLTKADVDACPDAVSLRAMERVARQAPKRTPADPKGTPGSKIEPTAEDEAKAEITAWDKSLATRAGTLSAQGNLSEVGKE